MLLSLPHTAPHLTCGLFSYVMEGEGGGEGGGLSCRRVAADGSQGLSLSAGVSNCYHDNAEKDTGIKAHVQNTL